MSRVDKLREFVELVPSVYVIKINRGNDPSGACSGLFASTPTSDISRWRRSFVAFIYSPDYGNYQNSLVLSLLASRFLLLSLWRSIKFWFVAMAINTSSVDTSTK